MSHRSPKLPLRSLLFDLYSFLLFRLRTFLIPSHFDNRGGNLLFIGLDLGFLIAFAPARLDLERIGETDLISSTQPLICESGIRTYLIGQLLLYLFYSLPQRPLQYYIENFNPEAKNSKLVGLIWTFWSIFTVFDIIWFFVGQYWTFTSSLCKVYDPALYWLAVVHIVFFYLTTIIPIILYAVFVLVARRRRREAELNGGTGPAAHLKGGLSKAELSTLRTFIFRTPNMTVAPEDDAGEDVENDQNSMKRRINEDIKLEKMERGVTEQAPEGEAMSAKISQPIYGNPSDLSTLNENVIKDKGKSVIAGNSLPPANLDTVKGKTPAVSTKLAESDLPSGAPTNCTICFCDFEAGDIIRELACGHIFHVDCIDPWLIVPDTPASSSTPQKAHRTCPLCVQEVILPQFRDKDVELAMELQKKEDAEMAVLLERLKKEAEEEQALIERRRKRAEEKRLRRANGGFGGLLLKRGRSRTTEPSKSGADKEEVAKRSASVDSSLEVGTSSNAAGDNISPHERLKIMKSKLESIKLKMNDAPRVLDDSVGDENIAAADNVRMMIEAVEVELQEEENARLEEALGQLREDSKDENDSSEKTVGGEK